MNLATLCRFQVKLLDSVDFETFPITKQEVNSHLLKHLALQLYFILFFRGGVLVVFGFSKPKHVPKHPK